MKVKTDSVIEKSQDQMRAANLPADLHTVHINWEEELANCVRRSDGFLNIAHEAVDLHLADSAQARKTALRFISKQWPKDPQAVLEVSYEKLASDSRRFAHALRSLGVKKGDVLFALSPRIPDLYSVMLGTLRAGAVFSPLFSAFGPEPIAARVERGAGKVLFSLASHYRKKIAPVRDRLATLKHIILYCQLIATPLSVGVTVGAGLVDSEVSNISLDSWAV